MASMDGNWHNQVAKFELCNTGKARPPNPPPRAPGGRVYVMRKEEAKNTPNVVTGNFCLSKLIPQKSCLILVPYTHLYLLDY